MLKITAAALARFAPGARATYVDTLLANLDVLKAAGILDSPLRVAHFMAQCAAETDGFRVLRESMAYRTPARLRTVWPARFSSKSDEYLLELCQDQVKLADTVYGGRMGNAKGTSDGYDYRGGLWLQTTGKGAVETYCKKLEIEPSPACLDDPLITLRFACLEWQESGCNQWADEDGVLKVSKAIKTGSATSSVAPVGMPDRRHWLAKAKAVWLQAETGDEYSPDAEHEDVPVTPREQPMAPVVSTAVRSKSLWTLLNAKLLLAVGVFTDWLQRAFDWVMWVMGVLPAVTAEVRPAIEQGEQISTWLKFDWARISFAVVLVGLAVVFVRHLNDKREKEAQ